MANIWEKAILILAGNLNSDLSYLITTVLTKKKSLPRALALSFFSVINLISALVRFAWIKASMNPFYRECFSEFLKHGLFGDFTVFIPLPVLFGASL